jgi:glycosyltransferase involved in cell wall biosynthesis
MNVLLVDHAPFFGGAEAFLVDLLSALDPKNFASIIVTDPRSPVLERLRATRCPVLTTSLPKLNNSPLFLPRLIQSGIQLAQRARASHADLLHTFGVRTHLIGAVASRLSGVPLVWRICDDTFPPRVAALFAGSARVIVAASQWLVTKYPNLKFDGLAQDGARAPAAISRSQARSQLGLSEDDIVITHVGRLVRWKGQDIFIRAFARVAREEANVRGLVVGGWIANEDRSGILGGGEAYDRELHALANELAPNRIVFTGFMTDPSLAYAASDIFAHTSILPEPFGRTVIEAMMAGLSVIASNAGALPEIVLDGQTGLLTTPGDVETLARAMTALTRSRDERDKMGQAAHVRAAQEFSLERMARRIEDYYRMALERA